MIETPRELAQLLYALLLMQDHIFGGVAIDKATVLVDSDGKMYTITVTAAATPPTAAQRNASFN